jgi:NAD-dependent deacetylase
MGDTTSLEGAADALDRAGLVAVSSGAGISKESGVPTFRDAQDGLWAKYDPQQLATPSAFAGNPDLVWSWYMYRASLVRDAEPNPGHTAVADLEDLVPQIVVLTQNVDGLHARAGSSDIVELHGRLGRWKCFENCQGAPTYIDINSIVYDSEHAPPCPYCTSRVRPDVVWFGEALPRDALERAFEVAQRCDVMLVVGTSGMVQPAASLPHVVRESGGVVIEINPEPSLITPDAHYYLQGKSGEVLPALVNTVRELRVRSERSG